MADDNELINQADIEALLQGGGAGKSDAIATPAPAPQPPADAGGEIDQSEIEKLLGGAGPAPSQPAAATASPPEDITDADKLLGQDDIEKLLSQSGAKGSGAGAAPSPSPSPAAAPAAERGPVVETISQGDVEFLFSQAEKALESVTAGQKELPPSAAPFQFGEFHGSPANTEVATLDLLNDVELDLKIELGRTNMYLEDVLKLRKGAVVPLDKLAGDPVDIYVNGRLIARGEVLVLNDNFCVRVAELVTSATPVM
jgi:flagellar motor switch protein FliN/FliY